MRKSGPARVVIIVENLPSPFDRRVWQEATTLVANDHEVSIVCPTGKGYEKKYEYLDGVHIYRYALPLEADSALGYAVEYIWALIMQFVLTVWIAARRGIDVIHACNPPDNIFMVALPFKLFGVRFLFDHHDINPELYEAKFGKRDFFYKVMLAWERWTFKFADVSIATNESYKQIAIERGGMQPEDVFIVRSGPDLSRMRIQDPDLERKKGRRYLVGYIGVMGKQEGIDLLLDSIHHLVHKKGRQDIHFCLIGSGTELEEMRRLAQDMNIADYVEFTGRVSDAEMLDILNTADVCVNPDRSNAMNDKSTMNKVMEYMALGKPIVQFDLTEGRFSAQRSSLYALDNEPVDFADKIEHLLDNEEERKDMGQFGLQRIKNELAWDYQIEPLLAAYESVRKK